MLEQVKATIRKYNMYVPGDRVLVGVSGGPDSVALVHILKRLAPDLGIQMVVAHLNHSLRGQDAEEDANSVCALAEQMGLEVKIDKVDVAAFAVGEKVSTQMAARHMRYRFFEDTAKSTGCNKLATGHNANDQAETILLHFLRGSGPAGLSGIPPFRDGWITRPLIEVKRVAIEAYCEENNLATRLDKSNLKRVYTRNKLRLDLIPLLEKEFNSNLVETLVRAGEIFREEEYFLEDLTREKWINICVKGETGEIIMDLDGFVALPPIIQKRLIRYTWKELTGGGHDIGFVHIANIIDSLKDGQTGSKLLLPAGVVLTKSYRQVIFTRSTPVRGKLSYEYDLTVPGKTPIPETGYVISAEIEERQEREGEDSAYRSFNEVRIDYDSVNLPIKVRNRRQGDWFKPIGLNGSQKLKKFFIDHKIPRDLRDEMPIVVTADEQIIWLAGQRGDQRWSINSETKRILKLKLIRNIQKSN